MRKNSTILNSPKSQDDAADKTGSIRHFINRMKNKPYTCPFCKETLQGLNGFLAHLRDHCT